MDEALHEGHRRSKLRAVAGWFWHHRLLSILLILVIFFLFKPVAYQVTHINAISCGELSRPDVDHVTIQDMQNEVEGMQDIRCFVQAHQNCTAATLTMYLVGTDRGSILTFRTANVLGGCAFSEIAYYGGAYGAIFPYVDSNCRTMQQEQDGLHFLDCGNVPDSVFRI